jgi:uncharacterized protein
LDKSRVQTTRNIELENPVFIDLTSSKRSPVHLVGQALIDRMRAEKIAELYSPYFPDFVSSNESGICSIPRLEFYASKQVLPNVLLLVGELQASNDDVYANYDIAKAALDYGILNGCKTFLSCSIFRSQRAVERVYVAATSAQEASVLAEKLGDKPFPFGRIFSQTGPLLGMAKIEGFKAVSILGSIKGDSEDADLPEILLDRILRVVDLSLVQ